MSTSTQETETNMGSKGGRNLRAGSSANSGLVQYQYTAPTATPHLAAVPFHVPFFAGPAAVDAARRDTTVGTRDAGSEAGRSRRSGARNMALSCF